jgi:hypothetical protein
MCGGSVATSRARVGDDGRVFHLLRIVMPDRPGALGEVASAIGKAGGDIVGIEVVEHRADGFAVDDFTLDLPPGRAADALVSACTALEGVEVEFVGPYAAGGNLQRDLEAIEVMTERPQDAELVLVDLLPGVFPGSWGLLLEQRPDGTVAVVAATPGAPEAEGFTPPWLPLSRATRVLADPSWAPPSWHDVIAAIAPLSTPTRVVVVGRHGGPETLDSEVMRLAHLAVLAGTVRRVGRIE